MKISFYYMNNQPSFGTTGRYYKTKNGDEFGTNSWLFRDDVDWRRLARYEKNHFSSRDKVNIIQFASSDGSEAYTQIISLLENLPEKDSSKFFPIKAYDIDEESVNAAKSGKINTCYADRLSLQMNTDDYTKYFTETNEKLYIQDDIKLRAPKTFNVAKLLQSKVIFENSDMHDILGKITDNSNTILLCRNVLGYFENTKIENFVKMAANKLKQGSLFVIGGHDTKISNITTYLAENKFMQVFKNVYQKL